MFSIKIEKKEISKLDGENSPGGNSPTSKFEEYLVGNGSPTETAKLDAFCEKKFIGEG